MHRNALIGAPSSVEPNALLETGIGERYRRWVTGRQPLFQRFLLPGFSQTAGAWNEVVDSVSPSELISCLEIPAAADFVSTARALAVDRSGIWAGYSLGGRLALQIAVDHPGQAESLLLVSTTPGITDPGERAERSRDDLELANWVEAHTSDEFLDRWLAQPMFAGLNRPRDHRLTSTELIADQLRTLGQGTQLPLWDRLAALDMPVVLMAGAKDAKYSQIAHQMASLIGANAEVHIVPGVGHALLEETPELVRALLLRL